jgi:YD repeat-containing protein
MTVTDSRSKVISYTYDADGRRTAEYDTTGGALESPSTEVAAWTYDTLAKGQPTSSTSYSGGAAYTEAVTGYNAYEKPSGHADRHPVRAGRAGGNLQPAEDLRAQRAGAVLHRHRFRRRRPAVGDGDHRV